MDPDDSVQGDTKPVSLLKWTSTTTRLLTDGGTSAWNFVDDAIEHPINFVSLLNSELQATGITSRLSPARTKGDLNIDMLVDILKKQSSLSDVGESVIEAATQASLPPATVRGDRSHFIERDYRASPDFAETHPCLSQLLTLVERTVEHTLGDAFDFDYSLTSVQLAEYPGDGTSMYKRHCDRDGNSCRNEQSTSSAPNNGTKRLITVLYYLTPNDWSAELDQGHIRLFQRENDYTDVPPYSNRMLLFRSDCVEHEVRPSLRRCRRAITIWFYGKTESTRHEIEDRAHCDRRLNVHHPPSAPEPLPIPDTLSPKHLEASIFVSMAAYRDSETGPTLLNLMETAHVPDRVFVGLVLQIDTSGRKSYDKYQILGRLPTGHPWFESRVRTVTLDARFATGPCPARAMCQILYRGEDYMLQIDSHMRFRRNWDVYLIEQLNQCDGPNTMLTTYPIGYELPNNIPQETRGTLLVPSKFGPDGMLRQRGCLLRHGQPDRPVLCHLYAAGFNFSRGHIIQDCAYDGSLHELFFGEEMSMAVRLFTLGWNLYAPGQSVCYHLWTRSHRPPPLALKSDESKDQRERSLQTVRDQLAGKGPGLGSVRSSEEFERVLGVDFGSLAFKHQGQAGDNCMVTNAKQLVLESTNMQ